MQHHDKWGVQEMKAATRNPPVYQAAHERSSYGDSTQQSSCYAQPRSGFELYRLPRQASYNLDPAEPERPPYLPQASPQAGSSRPPYKPPAAYRPGGGGGQGYGPQTTPAPSYQPGGSSMEPHGSQASQAPAYQSGAASRGAQDFESQTASAPSYQADRYGIQRSQPIPAYRPGSVQAYGSESAPTAAYQPERMHDREHQQYRSQAAPVLSLSGSVGTYQPMRQARQEDPAHYTLPPLGSADYVSEKPLYAMPSKKSAYGRQVLPPASYQPLDSTSGGHPASVQQPASVMEGGWSDAEEEPPSRAAHPGGMGPPSTHTRQPTSPQPAYQPYQHQKREEPVEFRGHKPLKHQELADFRGHSEPHLYQGPSPLAIRRPPLEETAYMDPQQRPFGRGVDSVTAGAWDPADSYDRMAHKPPPARAQPAPAQYDPYHGQQYASNEPRGPVQQMSGWDSPSPTPARTRAPAPPRDDFGNQRCTGYTEEAADKGYRAPPPAKQGFSQSGGWLSPQQSGHEEPMAFREAGHRPRIEQPVQQQAHDRRLSPRATQTARFESGDASAYDSRPVSRPPAVNRTAPPNESWDRPAPKTGIGADNWGEPTEPRNRPPPKTAIGADTWGKPTASRDRPAPKSATGADSWGEPTASWDRPPPKTATGGDNWGEPTASRDRPPPKSATGADSWGEPSATGTAHDAWGPTDQQQPTVHNSFNEEPSGDSGSHGSDGHSDPPLDHRSFLQRLKRSAAALKVPTHAQLIANAKRAGAPKAPPSVSQNPDLERPGGSYALGERGRFDDNRSHHSGPPDAMGSSSHPLDRSLRPRSHGNKETEDVLQWDMPVKHCDRGDNVSGWDTSPKPGSRNEKAAYGGTQRDTMPQHGFTNDERHGGRAGGPDNGVYRSRQAFDREEVSYRGGPGRQQATSRSAEDSRGFSRGPAPAETETYGGWGAVEHKAAEAESGWGKAPDRAAKDIDIGEWGSPAASAEQPRASREATRTARSAPRAAEPFHEPPPPKPYQEPTKAAAVDKDTGGWGGGGGGSVSATQPAKEQSGWGELPAGVGGAAQPAKEQMGWGEPRPGGGEAAQPVEEQTGWGGPLATEQMGWGEPAAKSAEDAWGADTAPRHSEHQQTAKHDGDHDEDSSDAGSGHGLYAAFEPPAMLTREERLAKIKAAMAKVGTIPTRAALLENANKRNKERRARREAKEAEAEARGEPIERREVAPTLVEDNIQGWGEPPADASAAGNDGWGPVDDGGGWGGATHDAAAADQPQKENEAPQGAEAAPAAHPAFQPVKAEDVQSDKRAPLDVDLNNIDIEHQAAAGRAAAASPSQVASFLAPSNLVAAALTTEDETVSISLTVQPSAAQPVEAAVLPPQQLPAAEPELRSVHLVVNEQDKDSPVLLVVSPSSGNSCPPAEPLDVTQLHSRLESLVTLRPGSAANGIAADLKGKGASAGAAHLETAPSGPSPDPTRALPADRSEGHKAQPYTTPPGEARTLKEAPSEAANCEGQDNEQEVLKQQPEVGGSTEATVAGAPTTAKLQVFEDAVRLVIGTAGVSAEQAIAEDGTAEHPVSVFSAGPLAPPLTIATTEWAAAGGASADAGAEGCPGHAAKDREAADSRRAKRSSLEETEDVDPSVSPRKVQMQRVHRTPSWGTPPDAAPANQQQVESEPVFVLSKVTSEEAGESQDDTESGGTPSTSTVVEPPTSERSFAGRLATFAGSNAPATRLMKPQKEVALHPVPGSMLVEEKQGETTAATVDTHPAVPAIAGLPAADKPKDPAAGPTAVPGAAPALLDTGHSTDSADSAKRANSLAKKEVTADPAQQADVLAKNGTTADNMSSAPSFTAAFAQDAPAEHLNAANAGAPPAGAGDAETAANDPAESAAPPKTTPAGETNGVPAKADLLKNEVQQGHVQSQQDTAQAAPFNPAAAADLDIEDQAAQKLGTAEEPGGLPADEPVVMVMAEDSKSQPSVDVRESAAQQIEGGSRKLAEGCKDAGTIGDSEGIKTEPAAAKPAVLLGDATSEVEGSEAFDGILSSEQKTAVEPPHPTADRTIQQAALPPVTGAVPASAHTASASTGNESAFSEAAGKGVNAVPAEADVATADTPTHAHLHLLLRLHRQ